MAETFKQLGQVSTGSSQRLDTYSVPQSTTARILSVFIANNSGATRTFEISHAVSAAAYDAKQILYPSVEIDDNDTFLATTPLELSAADIVRCSADGSGVSFNIYGIEIT